MSHHCHYPPCKKVVPRKLFMCRSHWFRLPPPLRSAVWREYNPGQEKGDAPVTQQYQFVTDEAVKYLIEEDKKQAEDKARQGELF